MSTIIKNVRCLIRLFPIVLYLTVAETSYSADKAATIEDVKASMQTLGQYRFVYRMFFKLYDAALYTDVTMKEDADKLLSGNHALHLEFDYLRKIKKSIILESSEKILANNMTPKELDSIQARVDQINAAYRTVDKGDRSALTYLPGKGTTLWINGEPIIHIEGADFARLYFRIWLGKRPISKSMRDALLGNT